MHCTVQSGCNPDVFLFATALTSGGCSEGLIGNSQVRRPVSVPVTLTENCNSASEKIRPASESGRFCLDISRL